MGLIDRIRKAETWNDISLLLMEGDAYEKASSKTKRRWKKVAQKRKQELLEP